MISKISQRLSNLLKTALDFPKVSQKLPKKSRSSVDDFFFFTSNAVLDFGGLTHLAKQWHGLPDLSPLRSLNGKLVSVTRTLTA